MFIPQNIKRRVNQLLNRSGSKKEKFTYISDSVFSGEYSATSLEKDMRDFCNVIRTVKDGTKDHPAHHGAIYERKPIVEKGDPSPPNSIYEVQQTFINKENNNKIIVNTTYQAAPDTIDTSHLPNDVTSLTPAFITHHVIIQNSDSTAANMIFHEETTQFYNEDDSINNALYENKSLIQSLLYRFSDNYTKSIELLDSIASDMRVTSFNIKMEDTEPDESPRISINMIHKAGHQIYGEHALYSIQRSKTCRNNKDTIDTIQEYLNHQRDGFMHIVDINAGGNAHFAQIVRHNNISIR